MLQQGEPANTDMLVVSSGSSLHMLFSMVSEQAQQVQQPSVLQLLVGNAEQPQLAGAMSQVQPNVVDVMVPSH